MKISISFDDERFERIERVLNEVKELFMTVKPEIDEVLNLSRASASQVGAVKDAVNALEAKITELAARGVLTDEDRAALIEIADNLRGSVQGTSEAIADAADGVDEAATPAP